MPENWTFQKMSEFLSQNICANVMVCTRISSVGPRTFYRQCFSVFSETSARNLPGKYWHIGSETFPDHQLMSYESWYVVELVGFSMMHVTIMETILPKCWVMDWLIITVMTVSLELALHSPRYHISWCHHEDWQKKVVWFPSRVFLHGLGSKCEAEIHCWCFKWSIFWERPGCFK